MASSIPWRIPSRGVRNNNPGNLVYVGQKGATMESGVDDPRFAQFPTMQAGMDALDQQLARYRFRDGLNTPRKIANRYAPKGDGDNDPDAYATHIAQATGTGDPDAPLPDDPNTATALRNAIISKETPDLVGGNQAPAGQPQMSQTPPQQDAGHTPQDLQQAVQQATGPEVQDPDAPKEVEDDDPEEKPGFGKFLQTLADIGAGAGQGSNWAESLASGVANANRAEAERAAQMSRVQDQNVQNRQRYGQQRLETANTRLAQRQFSQTLLKNAGELSRTTGLALPSALALVTQRMNPTDVQNAQNAQSPEIDLERARMQKLNQTQYSGAHPINYRDDNGNVQAAFVTTGDDGSVVTHMPNGQTMQGIPQNAMFPNQTGMSQTAGLNAKSEDADADAQTEDARNAEELKTIQANLPNAYVGGTLSDRAARGLASLTGGNDDKNAVTQMLSKKLASIKVGAMSSVKGRMDKAEQDTLMASNPDIKNSPEMVNWFVMQNQSGIDARQAARQAWVDYKDQNPSTQVNRKHWIADYETSHPARVVPFDEAKQDYQGRLAATSQQNGQPTSTPTQSPSQAPNTLNMPSKFGTLIFKR